MDTDAEFPEPTVGYVSKNPIIRNLFWNRIETAISLGEVQDDSVILDLGCQRGNLLSSIRKSNMQCECWGTDINPKVTSLSIPNCTFKIGDASSLPFPDGYFTVVFVLDVLEHIDNDETLRVALREIDRVLLPHGIIILSGPTESLFYKLCRVLQFGHIEVDYHFRTVYELEQEFINSGFMRIISKALPRAPFPPLFRITKFQKQN